MRSVSPFLRASVFLCLVICLVQAQKNALYGVTINRAQGTNGYYLVQTCLVGGVGGMQNLTTNYEAQSGSYGISSFDTKRGIYYYGDGSGKPAKILATDVKQRTVPSPTLLTGIDYAYSFNYDNVNDRLLLISEVDRQETLASFQDGKLQDLWKAPQNLLIRSVGFDEAGQRLFLTNNTVPATFLVLDLATLQTKSFTLQAECADQIFLGRFVWSPRHNKAYSFTFARNPHSNRVLDTYVTIIDPDAETCEAVLIQVPFGFVIDCAIDASSDKIYFTQLINMGYLYFVYDIVDQVALSASVVSPPLVEPLNLAVGPSYDDINSNDENHENLIETTMIDKAFEDWKAKKRWQ